MNRFSVSRGALAAAVLLGSGVIANALPNLQLTILNGNYVGGTDETTYASGNPFTLYALMQPSASNSITDTYKISAAIVPKTGPGAVSNGSFVFDGTTVVVSSDMVYGVPPLESILSLQGQDPGDLADHGIFDTFFKEFSFTFDSSLTTTAFDAQTSTPSGALSDTNCNPEASGSAGNSCMYFKAFTINVANLTTGNVHFDLYNTQLCTNGQGQCNVANDVDVNQFAPFSHDAQSNGGGSTSSSGLSSTSSSGLSSTSSSGLSSTSNGQVPEPNSSALAILGLGLVAAGFGMRRRRTRS